MNNLLGFYTSVDRHMNNLLYRGVDEHGRKIYQKHRYKPRLFLESKEEDTKWKSIHGVCLEPMRFDSMSECKAFQKQYEGISSFRIYGNDRHIPAFIQTQFPDTITYKPHQIDVVTIDIETSTEGGFAEPAIAANEIYSIAIHSRRTDTTIVWGRKDYDPKLNTEIKIEYRKFPVEEDMLYDFIKWWADPINCPDVITGWNTANFDIPYLVNRISRVFGDDSANKLSPWGRVEQRVVRIKGRESVFYDIAGIQHLDYIELFKKFTVSTYGAQESYKLDFIAETVLGENKTDWGQWKTFAELYDNDFQKFIDYNVQDIVLVQKMDKKLNLLDLVFSMAYFGGVNYSDTLGTVAIWDAIIFRHLAKKHIAVPQNKIKFAEDFGGGYVKEVDPGRYEWVMSFDINSLYPSLIVQYNVSPETICKQDKIHGLNPDLVLEMLESGEKFGSGNLAIMGNGTAYSKDKQGFLPEIIEEMYARRVKIKAEMLAAKRELEKNNSSELEFKIAKLETEQLVIKVSMNSVYGALGSRYFRYFDLDLAEGITFTGQSVIRYAEKAVNKCVANFLEDKKNKDRVIAVDTDSNYVCLKDVIDKFKPNDPIEFLDQFGKRVIEPALETAFEDFTEKTHAFKPRLVMKREAIADRAIWTAKKKYMMHVHDIEGVRFKTPIIKITGLEAIKSSTPKLCRTELKRIFDTILNKDESDLHREINEFRVKFQEAKFAHIASPRSANNLKKFSDKSTIYAKGKGTPKQVRAALLYNHLLETHGLDRTYPKVQSGDKIRFLPLKMPNYLKEDVIGFHDHLPTEFKLDAYIDYDTQFEKVFSDPLNLVLKPIGWKLKPTASLDDFFG